MHSRITSIEFESFEFLKVPILSYLADLRVTRNLADVGFCRL